MKVQLVLVLTSPVDSFDVKVSTLFFTSTSLIAVLRKTKMVNFEGGT